MFDSTKEWRYEPHFFRCKRFFRSLFVTHANLPALFPLMCVRSDYIKSDLCRLVFFFFSFFFSSVSIPLDFGISFRKKRRNICLFCIEILRHISGPLLYIFVLCLECIFFCFPHKVLFISVLPSSISLCDARLCCVSCLVKNLMYC